MLKNCEYLGMSFCRRAADTISGVSLGSPPAPCGARTCGSRVSQDGWISVPGYHDQRGARRAVNRIEEGRRASRCGRCASHALRGVVPAVTLTSCLWQQCQHMRHVKRMLRSTRQQLTVHWYGNGRINRPLAGWPYGQVRTPGATAAGPGRRMRRRRLRVAVRCLGEQPSAAIVPERQPDRCRCYVRMVTSPRSPSTSMR